MILGSLIASAVLPEIKEHTRKELADGQLSQPGGVVVTNRGKLIVTDGVFGSGRLVLVHR